MAEQAEVATEQVPEQVADAETAELAEEVLVEEVSIDGMCGVY